MPEYPILDDFLETVRSPNTRRAYGRHLAAFLNYMFEGRSLSLSQLRLEHVGDYQKHLAGLWETTSSQNQATAAMVAFLKWVIAECECPRLSEDEVLAAVRQNRIHRTQRNSGGGLLSSREKGCLLHGAISLRDRAVLRLLIIENLEPARLVSLTLGDLVPVKPPRTRYCIAPISRGKGKTGSLDLSPETIEALETYLGERGCWPPEKAAFNRWDEPIFGASGKAHRQEGRPLTTRSVWNIVHAAATRAGISPCPSPRDLRRKREGTEASSSSGHRKTGS